MNNIIRIVVLLLTLALPMPALAEGLCKDIPWGEQLSTLEKVTFSHMAGDTRYYTMSKPDPCGFNKFEETRVTYGFRDNKLYATLIEIDRARDLGKVAGMLINEYGLPDTKADDGWDVYRWETDTLKIKLKSQYSTDRIKIGMYYKPLEPK